MNTAEFDQLLAGMKDLSFAIKAYHDNLIKAGFTKQQAFTLTVEYQKAMVTGSSKG